MKSKLYNLFIIAFLIFGLTACTGLASSLQSFSRVALDRAQTISSALALRDGYVQLKTQIVANIDTFTPEERSALEAEQLRVEDFYLKVVNLSRGGTASQMFVNSDEFLTTVLSVRGSVDRAISIVEPKIGALSTEGAIAASQFIGNYNVFSRRLDELMIENNHAETVRMAAAFLKSAVPVITSLLAR